MFGELNHLKNDIGDKVSDVAHKTGDTVSDLAHSARDIAYDALDVVYDDERVSDAVDRAQEIAAEAWNICTTEVTNAERYTAERIKEKISDIAEHVADDNWPPRGGVIIDDADSIIEYGEDILKIATPSNPDISRAIARGVDYLADEVKDSDISETVSLTSLYSAYRYAKNGIENAVSSADLDQIVSQGAQILYSLPENAAKIADECGLNTDAIGEKVDELAELTEASAKATVYLSARFALGGTRVFEKAFRTVYSSAEYAIGNEEKAAEIAETSKVDELVEAVNRTFDESEYVQAIGDAADQFGELAVDIALTNIAMSGIGTVVSAVSAVGTAGEAVEAAQAVSTLKKALTIGEGIAAEGIIALSSAADPLTAHAEDGVLTGEDMVSVAVKAGSTALAINVSSVINDRLINSVAKVAKFAEGFAGADTVLGGRITGTLLHAAIGGLDAGTFKIADEVSKITDAALGLEDSIDVKKEVCGLVASIFGGAAISAVSYNAAKAVSESKVFRDIVSQLTGKDYETTPDYFEQIYAEVSSNPAAQAIPETSLENVAKDSSDNELEPVAKATAETTENEIPDGIIEENVDKSTFSEGIRDAYESQDAALEIYGGKPQVSFFEGEEVRYGTPGSTKPDITRVKDGHLEGIEVKNYDITKSANRSELYSEVRREVSERKINMPEGSTQRIVLDVKGREIDDATIDKVISDIRLKLADIYPDIPIDIIGR